MTNDLENIEARKESREKLLGTIRCPLNLGAINNCMPASSYNSANSAKITKLEVPKPSTESHNETSSSRISVIYSKPPPRDVTVSDSKEVSRPVSTESSHSKASKREK